MSYATYTAEDVEAQASRCQYVFNNEFPTHMLRDYATLLRERESAKAAVTDEMVFIAIYGYDSASPSFHPSIKGMRAALEAVAPMLASETSDELKEWEEFGRQIEKRLRYNPWGFKGSYPEIIDQVMTMASARVPEAADYPTPHPETGEDRGTCCMYAYSDGWNDCRNAMLAAAPKPETEE